MTEDHGERVTSWRGQHSAELRRTLASRSRRGGGVRWRTSRRRLQECPRGHGARHRRLVAYQEHGGLLLLCWLLRGLLRGLRLRRLLLGGCGGGYRRRGRRWVLPALCCRRLPPQGRVPPRQLGQGRKGPAGWPGQEHTMAAGAGAPWVGGCRPDHLPAMRGPRPWGWMGRAPHPPPCIGSRLDQVHFPPSPRPPQQFKLPFAPHSCSTMSDSEASAPAEGAAPEQRPSAKLFLGGLSWDTTEGGERQGPGGSRFGAPEGPHAHLR